MMSLPVVLAVIVGLVSVSCVGNVHAGRPSPRVSLKPHDVLMVQTNFPSLPQSRRFAVVIASIDFPRPLFLCKGSGPHHRSHAHRAHHHVPVTHLVNVSCGGGWGPTDPMALRSQLATAGVMVRGHTQSIKVPIAVRRLQANESVSMEDVERVVGLCSLASNSTADRFLGDHECGDVFGGGMTLSSVSAPSPPSPGIPVTIMNVTAMPLAPDSIQDWIGTAAGGETDDDDGGGAGVGPQAFVEVAMKDFMSANLPGLPDILNPIIMMVMSPITDQFMEQVGSVLNAGIGLNLGQASGAENPSDIAKCLTMSLTYNLTNLLTDGITNAVTAQLTPELVKRSSPLVVDKIMSAVRPKVFDTTTRAIGKAISDRVTANVTERLTRSLPIPLTPALTQSLSRSLSLSLATVLAPPTAPKVPPSIELESCKHCWGQKEDSNPECAACYQQAAAYFEMYYTAYYGTYYTDFYARYYGDAVKAAMLADWNDYKTASGPYTRK